MKDKDVKKIVRKAYSKIATNNNSCCSCGCGSVEPKMAQKISKSIGYTEEEMNAVPEANLGLGCGNPTAFSSIKEGDVFLTWEAALALTVSWLQRRLGKPVKSLVWT